MRAGLMATLIEAPAAMRSASATGSLVLPREQQTNCRNYAASV